jgi:hypothetical protein
MHSALNRGEKIEKEKKTTAKAKACAYESDYG